MFLFSAKTSFHSADGFTYIQHTLHSALTCERSKANMAACPTSFNLLFLLFLELLKHNVHCHHDLLYPSSRLCPEWHRCFHCKPKDSGFWNKENIHNKGTQEKTLKFEVLNQGSLSVQTFFFFFLIRSVGDLFLHRYKSTLPSTPHAIPQQTCYHYSSRSGKGRPRAPEHLHLPVLHAAMHRQLTWSSHALFSPCLSLPLLLPAPWNWALQREIVVARSCQHTSCPSRTEVGEVLQGQITQLSVHRDECCFQENRICTAPLLQMCNTEFLRQT